MGVGRSSSLRTTAERSPLHDVRQPASRNRQDQRDTNSNAWTSWWRRRSALPIDRHSAPRPFTSRLGGARRDRTDDLLLAKQALSQLSYGPGWNASRLARVVGLGRLELPTSRLSSARSNQLSYKPKNPRSHRDLAVPIRPYGPKTGRLPFRMNEIRRGLVHERKRKEDGGVLPMDLTDPETGWP